LIRLPLLTDLSSVCSVHPIKAEASAGVYFMVGIS